MATKYVDPTSGSNSNNGNSMATAYLTLAFAGASPQTSAGDTIIVKNGTYTGATAILLCTFPSGRITTAETVGGVIVNAGATRGADAPGIIYAPSASTSNPTKIIGFEWYNFNYNDEYYALINTAYAANCKTILQQCKLRDVTWGSASGARWFGIISGGQVFSSGNQSWDLDRCLFYNIDIGDPAWFTGGVAPIFQGGSAASVFSCTITNCTFDFTSSNAITHVLGLSAANTGTIVFKNNIFYRNSGSVPFTNDTTKANNVLSTSTNNLTYNLGSSAPAGMANNLTSDPLFVSYTTRNYALRPGSPAIDSGVII